MLLDEASPEHQEALRNQMISIFDTLCMSPATDTQQPHAEVTSPVPRLGVDRRRMQLLTSLAPGADTIAAEAAYGVFGDQPEENENADRIAVVAALPFPEDVFPRTTSFVWEASRLKGDVNADVRIGEENARRVSTFRNWMNRFVADKFNVPLLADEQRSAKELRRELQDCCVVSTGAEDGAKSIIADRKSSDKARADRYARFRAAGEYIAIHSHLMIAITEAAEDADGCAEADDPNSPIIKDIYDAKLPASDIAAGTTAIIEVKRSGNTPGLLNQNPGITWSSIGPVVKIEYPRNWLSEPGTADELRKSLRLTVQYPRDGQSDPAKDQASFTKLIDNLNQFQKQTQAAIADLVPPETDDEFQSVIRFLCPDKVCVGPWDTSGTEDERGCLPEAAREVLAASNSLPQNERQRFLHGLHQIWKIRSAAAELARAKAVQYSRKLTRMYLVTISAAILLHFGSHWHVEHVEHGGQELTPAEGAFHIDDPRWLFQLGTILMIAYGLRLFQQHRNSRDEKTRFDYRSFSEAFRVQVYWILAGLGRSVPASYMHRQRGEMDWFRRAISSTTAPYDRWKQWFQDLSPRQQIKTLRFVSDKWVRGQWEYFGSEYQLQHELHRFHQLVGFNFALAGCVFVVIGLLCLLFPHHVTAAAIPQAPGFYGAVTLSVPAVWLSLWVYGRFLVSRRLKQLQNSEAHGVTSLPRDDHESTWPRPWFSRLSDIQDSRKQRAKLIRWTWFWLEEFGRKCGLVRQIRWLFLCGSFVVFGTAFSLLVASLHLPLPGLPVWSVLFAGIFLLIGGMSVAYAEKQLYSEHSYQYNAMGSFYRAALRRIEGHLHEVEQLCDQVQADGSRDELNGKMDLRIRAIQDVLQAVGEQALDENAEWLMLHRARPLEPVFAG